MIAQQKEPLPHQLQSIKPAMAKIALITEFALEVIL